jgi:polyhydroxybutyrate depolymerase
VRYRVRKYVAIGVLLLATMIFCGAAYYYLYSPPPRVPRLTGVATRDVIRIDNLDRTYLAYVPAQLARDAPLVLVLHGSFMNGEMMRKGTGYEFDLLADRYGFVVVYPDGYKSNWNDCRRTAAYPAKRLNIDDMSFLRTIIQKFRTMNGAAGSPVFAVGYSDGGEMAHRLAIEAPAEIEAIAAIEANLPTASDSLCQPAGRPSRAAIISGTDDPIMPYGGGEITLFGFTPGRGEMRSAAQTAEYYLAAHHIENAPEILHLPHKESWDNTSVEQSVWSRDGSPAVEFYTIKGGGHVIPQPAYRWPRFLGRQTQDLNAPAAIWAFFARKGQPGYAAGQ